MLVKDITGNEQIFTAHTSDLHLDYIQLINQLRIFKVFDKVFKKSSYFTKKI